MFKNKTELDNIFWENVRTLVLSLKFRTQMILSQMLNLVIFKKNATSIWLHFWAWIYSKERSSLYIYDGTFWVFYDTF